MTDDELRSHFQPIEDAAPDFSKILERQKRHYRPRPLAAGLLILLIAIAPVGWVWTNSPREQIANINHRMEAITANRPAVRPTGTQKASPAAAAAAPTPVATRLLKPPAAAQVTACKPVPVPGTHTLPPYPGISAQLRESGTTSLEITVARNGFVSGAKVTHSSGFPRLDVAAASYVRQNYLWQPLACASAKTRVNVRWEMGSGGAR